MKRLNILLLHLFMLLITLQAQEISVKSFRLLPNDLTANIEGTQRFDPNTRKNAALIKVVTSETGFYFDGGMSGLVGDPIQKLGEVWVYVPEGAKKITINHKVGVLRDYYYPEGALKSGKTYEMKLITGSVRTIVEEDLGGNYLLLTINPPNAEVLIDGNMVTVDTEGVASTWLKYGTHQYEIFAPMHKREIGAIVITPESTTEKTITLQPNYSIVTLTAPNQADIYVNNEKKGTGRWEGKLGAGEYMVEARKESHYPTKTTLKVEIGKSITKTLEAPIPRYGIINIQSTPAKATLLIDGEEVGITPGVYKNILIGERELTLKKEGYETLVKTVTIEEGNVLSQSFTLQAAEEIKQPLVKQENKSISGTHNGHEYVDLGLSVMWATCNVGATSPEEYGDYFAWGETSAKRRYSSLNHKYSSKPTTLPVSADAASANWGGSWRMPTKEEQEELRENSSWIWTTQNGVNGYKVTSRKNGNSIFLPAAGWREDSYILSEGLSCDYWSSSRNTSTIGTAYYLSFLSNDMDVYNSYFGRGHSVRAVKDNGNVLKQVTVSTSTTPSQKSGTNNGYEYVDLGLSVKWATCNVGADSPEDYGDYFAWGETTPKSSYSLSNHKHTSNPTILPLSEDAARTNLGGTWRMPTREEQDELRENCTWEWTTQRKVKGYKVTSKKNGNSIFIPAAGYCKNNSLNSEGTNGGYWSRSLGTNDSSNAYYLFFNSESIDWYYSYRYFGLSVRAVCP